MAEKRGVTQKGAQQLEEYLRHTLDENIAMAKVGKAEDIGLVAVQTFEQVGLRSSHHGLVVRMRDGSEYQLPILPSSGLRNLDVLP